MPEENERINGTVLTMFSTASAVGKTLISCNFAAELARQNLRVCLMDLDLQFGDVCNYLQITPKHTIADAQQAFDVQGENFSPKDFLSPYEYEGTIFYVMAAPLKLEEAYNMSTKSIKEILKKLQSTFDYIIVDTTSMFSVLNLELLDMSTIVMFLGIVDFIPTIKNMKIGSDTLKNLNYDKNKLRVILNRSGANTHISVADVQKLLGSEFDFILPNDFHVASRSIKTGVPLVLEEADSQLAQGLRVLVTRYTGARSQLSDDEEEPMAKSGGWFSRLFR